MARKPPPVKPEYEDLLLEPADPSIKQVGLQCGRPTCAFTTVGWDTEEQARARMVEHHREHETGELMTELTEFEKRVGYERKGT